MLQPFAWLKAKFDIKDGCSYREANISLTQAAAWIGEYLKLQEQEKANQLFKRCPKCESLNPNRSKNCQLCNQDI